MIRQRIKIREDYRTCLAIDKWGGAYLQYQGEFCLGEAIFSPCGKMFRKGSLGQPLMPREGKTCRLGAKTVEKRGRQQRPTRSSTPINCENGKRKGSWKVMKRSRRTKSTAAVLNAEGGGVDGIKVGLSLRVTIKAGI